MAATPRIPGRINDRRLYILAAILTPLIVLAGFGRTYYLKGFFGTPDLPGRIVHLRLHPVFLWGSIFIIVMQPLRLLLAGTDVWLRFAAAVVGLVQ